MIMSWCPLYALRQGASDVKFYILVAKHTRNYSRNSSLRLLRLDCAIGVYVIRETKEYDLFNSASFLCTFITCTCTKDENMFQFKVIKCSCCIWCSDLASPERLRRTSRAKRQLLKDQVSSPQPDDKKEEHTASATGAHLRFLQIFPAFLYFKIPRSDLGHWSIFFAQ